MQITELYRLLFGKTSLKNGSVIDMAEHGRAGGVSTGTGFKGVQIVPNKTLIDEVDADTTYIGVSKQGGSTSEAIWMIRKITTVDTVTSILFADGDDQYNNVWDDRVSLSYS